MSNYSSIIKIRTNLNVNPSYNPSNIECVLSGNMQQKINYTTLDEYNIPYGTYATLRNYDNISFDEATRQTGDEYYSIIDSSTPPDCETMYTLFNEYTSEENCKGVVVISTSEEVYNEIVVEYKGVQNDTDFRITNIYLNGEYKNLNEAVEQLGDDSPVVFNFDDVRSSCARYWKWNDDIKTSAFDDNPQQEMRFLSAFTGNFGNETWTKFNVLESSHDIDSTNGNSSSYIINCGQHYIPLERKTYEKEVLETDYNIFDALFRFIYDYLYEINNTEDVGADDMKLSDPSRYTFLLKTYKMYVKSNENSIIEGVGRKTNAIRNFNGNLNHGQGFDITSPNLDINAIGNYSVKILSVDEFTSLDAEEAQEYFNNTVVHNIDKYKDTLILTEEEAKEVLLLKNISSCGNYFIISSNVGIKLPSSETYEYYDLGNFELKYTSFNIITRKPYVTEYKYNINGKVARVRRIYDPYEGEYYMITQNNNGEFPTSYNIDRNGVIIRGISGKNDLYFFENTEDGKNLSEQFKEDVLYAIEGGPSIIVANNLADVVYFANQ